jgi:hypothetical protein
MRRAAPAASGHQRQAVRLEGASRLDGRGAELARRGPVWRLEQVRRPAPHREQASVIRVEAHQDGRAAGCRGPASQSVQGWPSAQASGGPSALRAQARALRWAPVTVRPVPEARPPEEVAAAASVSRAWSAAAEVEELASVPA